MSFKASIEDGLSSLPEKSVAGDSDSLIVVSDGVASEIKVEALRSSMARDKMISEGMKAIVIGDSISRGGLGLYTSNNNIGTKMEGTGFYVMQQILGHPFVHNVQKNYGNNDGDAGKLGHNKGSSGDTIAGLKARFKADVMDLEPDICFLHIMTNSIANDVPLADLKADFIDIVERGLSAGIVMHVTTVLPRNDDDGNDWDNDTQRFVMIQMNQFIREYISQQQARGESVMFCDFYEIARDHFGTNAYDMASNNTGDGLHTHGRGGLVLGYAQAAPFESYGIKNMDRHYKSVLTDLFDASANPYGNCAHNPDLSGTGGLLSDGTGSLPDDYRLTHQSGSNSTCVASVVDAPDGGEGKAIKLTITSDGNGTDNERWLLFQKDYAEGASEGIVDGNACRAQSRVRVDNMTGNMLKQCQMQLLDADGGRDVFAGLGDSADVPLDAGSYDWLYVTPQLIFDANADRVRLEWDTYIDGRVAGSFDLYIWHPDWRSLESVPVLN